MKEFNWCFQRVGLYSRMELYSYRYGIRQEGGGNYFKWSESLCPKFSHLVTRYNASRPRGGEAASWLKCHQATAYVASSLAAAAEATTDFLFAPLSVCVCPSKIVLLQGVSLISGHFQPCSSGLG